MKKSNYLIYPAVVFLFILSDINIYCQESYLKDEERGLIHGIVRHSETNEPLAFANIWIPEINLGSVTDLNGSFMLSVPQGNHSLHVSYIGFESIQNDSIVIVPGDSVFFEIRLVTSAQLTVEVVVTANRNAQTLSSAPVSIDLIKSEEIQNQNLTTFDQIFDGVSGVNVSRSGGANVQALSIRGASEVAGGGIGNRVLLLIDGKPALSPESGGALWNLVPLNSIERVEVVKGAYSALFGSSAMGGVINVITKKPTEKPSTRLNFNYGFHGPTPSYADYDLYRDFSTMEIGHNQKKGPISYNLELSRKTNDGHREKSAYDLFNAYSKVSIQIAKNRHLTLSGNINKINNDTPASWLSTTDAFRVANHRKDDYQDRKEYNLDVLYTSIPGDKSKYTSRVYYYQNLSKYSFNDDPQNDTTNVNFGKQIVSESMVKSQRIGSNTQVDLYQLGQHYLLGGLDFTYDHVLGLPDTVLYGRHSAINVGTYIQDEANLSKNLVMTLGGRVDYYNIIHEFNEFNFSPKLAFVYTLSYPWSVRLLLAQAYRNPAMAERYIKFEQGGGLRFQPNPDLQSEKLKFSFELGSRLQLGSGTFIDLAFFHNDYKNLISFQQIPNPQNALLYKVVNLKEALMRGIEFNINYRRFNSFWFNVGYTFLDACDRSENRLNDNLAYKVKHTLDVSVTSKYKQFTWNISGRYRSSIKEVFIYPGNEPDANFILNTNISALITENYRLYFNVKNISNTQYEELERYRMAGRSYTAGFNLQF